MTIGFVGFVDVEQAKSTLETRNARKACPDDVSFPEWILRSRNIDLEVELEGTKQRSKENLQQAILFERERVTKMQWDMDDLQRKSLEMESRLKFEQIFNITQGSKNLDKCKIFRSFLLVFLPIHLRHAVLRVYGVLHSFLLGFQSQQFSAATLLGVMVYDIWCWSSLCTLEQVITLWSSCFVWVWVKWWPFCIVANLIAWVHFVFSRNINYLGT